MSKTASTARETVRREAAEARNRPSRPATSNNTPKPNSSNKVAPSPEPEDRTVTLEPQSTSAAKDRESRDEQAVGDSGAQEQSGPTDTQQDISAIVLNSIQTRLNLSDETMRVLPSVLACMVVQAVAAFFYGVTRSTIQAALDNAENFSGDAEKDGDIIYIVFSFFTVLATAWCMPTIQKSGYKMLMLGGAAILLYSSVASSVVNSPYTLIMPYSIAGACGYGLLKTVPLVAILDYMRQKRELAMVLSQIAVSLGLITGGLAFAFSDLTDDANYKGNETARWPNNFRVIDITAGIAMGASTQVLPPTHSTGNWPELFKSLPFYILCLLNFFFGLGFDLLESVYADIPEDRDFEANPPGALVLTAQFVSQLAQFAIAIVFAIISVGPCKQHMGRLTKISLLLSAICMSVLSFLSYINSGVFVVYGTFVLFGLGAGFAKAVVSICLPLALINYTGSKLFKFGICFLEASSALGTMISFIMQAGGGTDAEARWYIAAVAFSLYCVPAFPAFFSFVPTEEEKLDPAVEAAQPEVVPEAVVETITPEGVLGAEQIYDGSLN